MFGESPFGGAAFGGADAGSSVPPPDPVSPGILFRLNGTTVPRVRFPALTIHDVIGAQPNTGQMTLDRIEPNVGAHVEIGLGSFAPGALLFAGEIQRIDETYQSKPSALLTEWQVDLIDESFAINKRRPFGTFVATSATTIAQQLVTSFAPGFTTTHIQAGLPAVSVVFDGSKPLLNCLADLANLVGGRCKVDYSRDVHLFLPPESGVEQPLPLTFENPPLNSPAIRFTVDLSQVRTRVYGRGHSEEIAADCASGETRLPIDDQTLFNAAGGTLIAGATSGADPTRVMTYTGVSADVLHVTNARGILASPPTPSPTQTSGQSGNLAAGSYSYIVTCVNAAGDESEYGAVNTGLITSVPAPGGFTVTPQLVPGNLDAGSYTYTIAFRTANGTTVAGSTASGTISGVPIPIAAPSVAGTTGGSLTPSFTYYYALTNVTARGETYVAGGIGVALTSGQNAVSVTNIWTSSDARVTGRRLYRSKGAAGSPSPPGGYNQWFLVTTINDNTTTTYLDTMADSALGVTSPINTAQTINAASAGQMTVSVPTSGDGRVTGRAVYRTLVNGSYPACRLVRVINDNTTTTMTDNTADSGLGPETTPLSQTADFGRMTVGVPAGVAGTASRRVYRYDGVSAYRFCVSIPDNTTLSVVDNVAVASLGVNVYGISKWRTTKGSTSLAVEDTAQFSEGAGWVTIGSQLVKFTGRSTTSGAGALTGIPASGVGSLVADVQAGTPVIGAPFLKGVNGTGIPAAMLKGSTVSVWIQRDNTSAQTALGLLERNPDGTPSDGIREYFLNDDARNDAAMIQLCDADLESFADPTIGVSYCCRDPRSKSGSVVHIDLQSSPAVFNPAVFNPAVFNTGTEWGFAGDYLIQSVTITIDRAPQLFPRYAVQASSVKFTFADLLQRVLIG